MSCSLVLRAQSIGPSSQIPEPILRRQQRLGAGEAELNGGCRAHGFAVLDTRYFCGDFSK
jgi:hypothetical protein